MPSTSVQMTSSSASTTCATIAPEKSELLRPSVVMRPSGVAPIKPVTTGTMLASRSGSSTSRPRGLVCSRCGFMAGVAELAARERSRNGKEMVGDALHGGDNHGDIGRSSGGSNEACGMEHAVCTEKRTAAELESDDLPNLPGYPASVMHEFVMSGL